MVVIRLFCGGGCSSDVLAKRMIEAAKKRNIEADIKAYGSYVMERLFNKEKVDVALIGPQIAFTMKKIKKVCDAKGVPVEVIPGIDYGRLNGDKVLDLALKIISENNTEKI